LLHQELLFGLDIVYHAVDKAFRLVGHVVAVLEEVLEVAEAYLTIIFSFTALPSAAALGVN
jgi:hypothetical protein